jgi:hypothetical protein
MMDALSLAMEKRRGEWFEFLNIFYVVYVYFYNAYINMCVYIYTYKEGEKERENV